MPVVVCVIAIYAFLRLLDIIYGSLWNKNLTVSLSFSENAVFEGERVKLREAVSNAKLLPLPWVTVKFQVSRYLSFFGAHMLAVSDDCYKKDVFSVFAYQKITRVFSLACEKRGYYFIKSAELIAYNLNYSRKYVANIGGSAVLTVYPKLINLRFSDTSGDIGAGETIKRSFANADPFAFRGIREYAPGDLVKSVNARASAKNARLMVNTFDVCLSKEAVIFLNLQKYASYVNEALFEKAVSLAASLAAFFTADNIAVNVVSGSYDCFGLSVLETGFGATRAHFYSILSALAKLDAAKTEKIADFLPRPPFEQARNRLHVLISTFSDAELTEKFMQIKSAGLPIKWVMPLTGDMPPASAPSFIYKWNIEHEPETRFIF